MTPGTKASVLPARARPLDDADDDGAVEAVWLAALLCEAGAVVDAAPELQPTKRTDAAINPESTIPGLLMFLRLTIWLFSLAYADVLSVGPRPSAAIPISRALPAVHLQSTGAPAGHGRAKPHSRG